jgi:hypothetical protein
VRCGSKSIENRESIVAVAAVTYWGLNKMKWKYKIVNHDEQKN